MIQEISKALKDVTSKKRYSCPHIEVLFQHTEDFEKKEPPTLTVTEK